VVRFANEAAILRSNSVDGRISLAARPTALDAGGWPVLCDESFAQSVPWRWSALEWLLMKMMKLKMIVLTTTAAMTTVFVYRHYSLVHR
jgi:hypothetical protein